MKTLFAVLFCALLTIDFSFATESKWKNEPDSAWLFSYGINGLRFAWSLDKVNWNNIGNGYIYLKSDYGRWGTEKKMINPYLIQGRNHEWQIVWSLNDYAPQFAHAGSKELVHWGPQSYPYVTKGKNVLRPVISYNKTTDLYTIVYADGNEKYFQTTTKDFKVYTAVIEVAATQYKNQNVKISLDGETTGQLHRVAWPVVSELKKAHELQNFKTIANAETTREDMQRFAGLKTVDAKIVLQPQQAKPISNMLTGVFFEDLNYAADGGLYGELIQNRDFEYQLSDKSFRDKNWNSKYAWSLTGNDAVFTIDSTAPVHPNNPHYAILDTKTPGTILINSGYDGIAVKKGEAYNFSVFCKQLQGAAGRFEARLVSTKEGVLAKIRFTKFSSRWTQLKETFISSADAGDVHLELELLSTGKIAFDMVSLLPQKTFKERTNGLRADIAQAIADIHPRFVRFPGGCLAHGDGIQNIYKWKNSIGPLESRKPDRNLWGYHQTMGLGYFEYFQFCEDIGAEPVPVIAAGVPCQNSSTGGGGQQGGIPMNEMGAYIQDIIDLVEYANGDINTVWGKKRAEAGHPEPFKLKYIGIGNEDQVTEVFRERFEMIYKALRKAHPEITVIGTAGPFFEGTDYEQGWKIASDLKVPMIDEHYYLPPGWFINNQDFYDSYDRSKSKVYLGEYAAHFPAGNKTNLETSLAEALYLTSLERNGDIVSMASYAPLIAKEGHTQWNPDLIYFTNTEVKPTTGYYVQQLYGQNSGDQYIPAAITVSSPRIDVSKRIAYSIVKNTKTNELIVKLVNLLPVAANTTIDFNGLLQENFSATKTVLLGNPAEKTAKPVVSETPVSNNTLIEIPAYSFTVLKMKLKP